MRFDMGNKKKVFSPGGFRNLGHFCSATDPVPVGVPYDLKTPQPEEVSIDEF